MIDKLVAYCDYRALRYNNVTVNKCAKSNYYVFGDIMVRISDHAKYGFNKNAKNYDYSFIVQENGQYIFCESIKNNDDGIMHLKIVNYEDAKTFIKQLHDFSMIKDKLTDYYQPKNFNSSILPKMEKKITWDEFSKKYLNDFISDMTKINILNHMEYILTSKSTKGTWQEKIDIIEPIYNQMDNAMFTRLKQKMNLFITKYNNK